MRKLALAPLLALIAAAAFGQALTLPPSGDNQHAIVTQFIGPVKVTVDYNSPKIHHPVTHEDRRGKIWGKLVPYGLTDLGFGTCKECPWRAGANQNTTFSVSHPVKIEGQDLPAGTYGFFLIAEPDPQEWTAVFSKNSTSWGSFFYDPKEDQLRVKVKPEKSEYNEFLTYEFTERQPDHATVAMKWEDLQVPIHITVPDIDDVYLTAIKQELRNAPGFNWQNWNQAARFALRTKRLDDAYEFAKGATDTTFGIGVQNYQTLSTLADVQEARNMPEAQATRAKALAMGNAIDLHQYARQLLQKGNKTEAVRVWQMNAKLHPNEWPVKVGLMRAYSAEGKYKDALKYAKEALPQAPDPQNKKSLEDAIKKLQEGKDVNG